MSGKIKIIIGIVCSIIIILIILIFLSNKKNSFDVSDYTVKYLNKCGIKTYQVEKISNYHNKKLVVEPVKIKEKQVQEYIDTVLESYAYMQPVTNRTEVINGDFVYVSYQVYSEGECIKDVSGDVLKVGAGFYDNKFEKLLPGAVVGESFVKNIYDTEKNKEHSYRITVDSIQEYITYEFNNQFVQEKFDIETVEEYYEIAKEKVLNEEVARIKQQAENDLLEELLRKSKINFSDEEIAIYAKQIVEKYNQLAYISQMNLQEYYTQKLDLSEQEFYKMCCDEAKLEVGIEVLIGVIAEQENIVVTKEEINEYLQQIDENADEVSIAQYILRNKVISLFEKE